VDAVLSTTALHWLAAGDLARLYQQVGALVRPGGVLLNGDHLRFAPHLPTLQRVVSTWQERQATAALARHAGESWRAWWAALAQEQVLQPLLDERARRFPHFVDDEQVPIAELHEAALRAASFREVGIIWRRMEEGVIMAVR
ncbi:MAG TPA: class I SAM-dependent methyltransferase, partial [Ktedonobacterales bacterium]